MAGTKGEKIVTILCDKVVTPAKDGVWPSEFTNLRRYHDDVLPPEKEERARVVGVFMRDGAVFLLLQNLIDDKLAESPAVGWKLQ